MSEAFENILPAWAKTAEIEIVGFFVSPHDVPGVKTYAVELRDHEGTISFRLTWRSHWTHGNRIEAREISPDQIGPALGDVPVKQGRQEQLETMVREYHQWVEQGIASGDESLDVEGHRLWAKNLDEMQQRAKALLEETKP